MKRKISTLLLLMLALVAAGSAVPKVSQNALFKSINGSSGTAKAAMPMSRTVNYSNYATYLADLKGDSALRTDLQSQKWLFTHASIGADIIEGMRQSSLNTLLPTATFTPANVRTAYSSALNAGGMQLYTVNRGDTAPAGAVTMDDKIQYFTEMFEVYGWDQGINIAMNKFSIHNAVQDMTNAIQLTKELRFMEEKAWTVIRNTEEKRRDNPTVTLVYATMPLVDVTTDPALFTNRTTRNLMIYHYNKYLRDNLPAGAYLFDIASILNNGQALATTPSSHLYAPNYPYESLDPAFAATAEGQLNTAGQKALGDAWYAMAASIATNTTTPSTTVATPDFNPKSGSAAMIGISCSTPGSVIYYTTNGETPIVNVKPNPNGGGNIGYCENGYQYALDILITQNTTIKAVGVLFAGGQVSQISAVATQLFTYPTNPLVPDSVIFSPASGNTISARTEIKLSWPSTTNHPDVFYTLDGSDSRDRANQYYFDNYRPHTQIILNQSTTIKAALLKFGVWGPVCTATYTLQGTPAPTPSKPDSLESETFDSSSVISYSPSTSSNSSAPSTSSASSANQQPASSRTQELWALHDANAYVDQDLNSTIAQTLSKNSKIIVLTQDGEWLKIESKDQTLWVRAEDFGQSASLPAKAKVNLGISGSTILLRSAPINKRNAVVRIKHNADITVLSIGEVYSLIEIGNNQGYLANKYIKYL